MKTVLSVLAIALILSSSPVLARKSCEELKNEIASGLDAKGVQGYSLTVLAKDVQDTRKAVGSCNGGSEKIVYERRQPEQAVAQR